MDWEALLQLVSTFFDVFRGAFRDLMRELSTCGLGIGGFDLLAVHVLVVTFGA